MLEPMVETDDIAPGGLRGLRRVEYDELVKLGSFDDERVELLRGQLVTMSPENWDHAEIGLWLFKRLVRTFGDDAFEMRHTSPFVANDDSEPEPDVFVGPSAPVGRGSHPAVALWLVEVSNTSIRKDRRIKRALYAEIGVPEYWIIDITRGAPIVEVYTHPQPGGYAVMTMHRDGDVVRPLHVPIDIAISEMPRATSGSDPSGASR